MRSITIAVTGLNNTDNPGPGIPVIRSLRESTDFNVRIIGLAYENLEPGIYMKGMVDKTYMIPYPSSGNEEVLNRILEIHEKEHIEVLFPNFDAELQTFHSIAPQLDAVGIKMFIPTQEQLDERDKNKLPIYGKKYGITVPKSIEITSLVDIEVIKRNMDYPVLVKGKFYDAHHANSPLEVSTWFNTISSKWGVPVIIQEFVKGTEINVVAVGDGKGNTIGAVPMRKQYITDKGKAWGGIVTGDQKLLDICKKIIAKSKWRGGMEIEMIMGRDGEYYLIEINPRLPAWVYLAVGAGQNLPEAIVKLALGEAIKPFDSYQQGTMFVRYSHDTIINIKDFEQLTLNREI